MRISLADLIPLYPSQDDPDFQAIISSKKEFNELKTGPTEEIIPGKKFKHQELFIRMLLTMDRGFLFHRTGTGKTCSMIGAAEYYRDIAESMITTFRSMHKIETPVKAGHAFIITQSSLKEEFEKQFFCACTNRKYITYELESTKLGTQRTSYIHREMKKWYTIDTYDKFAKKISKMSDEDIVREYSDSIFFVDEVQNISSEINWRYTSLHRVFHIIKRSKVFVASATPMVNSPEPIIYIMNLILPEYRQIPTSTDISKISDEKLMSYFSGMVSYIREMDTGVDIKYQGKPIELPRELEEELFKPQMNIVQLVMKKFQTDAYIKAVEKSEEDNEAFNINLMSVANFVFPDGSHGGRFPRNETFQRNVNKEQFTNGISKYVQSPKINVYKPTDEFKYYLSNLENIRRSSIKTGYIIDQLIKYPKKKAFVYDPFINGSGLIVKSLCLEYIRHESVPTGFSQYVGDSPAFTTITVSGHKSFCTDKTNIEDRKIRIQPKRRYAIITGDNLNNRDNILELFNSYENRYGEYIQVLLGSEVLQTGINLSDVTEVFVNAGYHESGTYQAISRAIRATSHVNLIEDVSKQTGVPIENVRIDVNVHKLAAIANSNEVDSYDLTLFLRSEEKDREIKQKEKLLMRAANDCHIHYDRNVRSMDVDGSAQCAYSDCNYECITKPPEKDDYSTFDILYMDNLIERLTNTLLHIFQMSPVLLLDELYKHYNDIEPKYLNRAIENMVYEKRPLNNNYGYTIFMQTQGNIIFVQYEYPSTNVHYPISEYPKMISVFENNSIDQFIKLYKPDITNPEKLILDVRSKDFKDKLLKIDTLTLTKTVEKAIIDQKVLGKGTELSRELINIFSPYLYSTYEPVKDIIRSKEELKEREKGKGRKPRLELMKPYKYKDKMYPLSTSAEKVYFHNLLEIKQTTTGYGKSNTVTKPSELIQILKPSEKTGWRQANPYELPVYNAIKENKYNEMMKKLFNNAPIYGTISFDGVFRIVDKSKDIDKKDMDKRTEPTGRECSTSSFYIEEMYKLLARFKIRPPKTVIDKIPKIAYNKMEPIVTKKIKETIDKLSHEDVEIIYQWIKSGYKRDKICPIIENYLKDNKLLLTVDKMKFID